MSQSRDQNSSDSTKENVKTTFKSFEFASNLEKHARGAPKSKLQSTLMGIFDKARENKHVFTAFEFGLELSSNENPSWVKEGYVKLAPDERVIAAATKVGLDVAVSTVLAEGGSIVGGLVAASSLPFAGFFGPAIVIGGAVAAFESDEIIKIATDATGLNLERSIIGAYRKLLNREPSHYQSLFTEIPIFIFDKNENGHIVKVRNYDDRIKILMDEHLRGKVAHKNNIIKPIRPSSRIIKFSHEQDKVRLTQLKTSLATGKPNPTQTAEILFDMQNPDAQVSQLSSQEKEQLTKIATQQEESCVQHFSDFMTTFVEDVNTITDHQDFTQSLQNRETERSSFIKTHAPILHSAFTIFCVVNPEKANQISGTIHHVKQMSNGARSIVSALVSDGIGAIATAPFSLGIHGILLGFTGLIKLFGKQENPNAAMIKMLQGISQQISQLREEMLEAFRIQSIALANIDMHVIYGFLKMEALLEKQNQNNEVHFEQIKKFLYIDQLYLEGFKKSFEQIERYHILQQINNADWRPTVDQVKTDCLLNPTAMSVETLKNGLVKLVNTLKTVQRDGIARAQQASLINYAQLVQLLNVANAKVGNKISKTLADNYQLQTEQNIHLLARYLSSKPGYFSNIPKLDELVNPAALYDLSDVARELMQTYRKTFAYLGLPEDPVRESLNYFVKSIHQYDAFIQGISNSKAIENLYSEYLRDVEQFSRYSMDYQTQAAAKYYSDHTLPLLKATLQQDELMLTGLDKSKTRNFFIMQGRSADGRGWFDYQWSHWWPEAGRWSPGPANAPSCHRRGDRPCWKPDGEIHKMIEIYKRYHHYRAENIHNGLVNYHQSKRSHFDSQYTISEKEARVREIRNLFFNDSAIISDWHSIPYYFQNSELPFLVSDWHIKQIPNNVFQLLSLGKGQLKFTWNTVPERNFLKLQGNLEIEEQGYKDTIILFTQITPELPGHQQKLPLLESVHYLINGGMQPIGNCRLYDPDLRRFSELNDVQAIHDYWNGKASGECGHCHALYRTTVCAPDTTDVVGLFPDSNAYAKLPSSTVEWVSKWNYTPIKEADTHRITQIVSKKKRQVRQEIAKEFATQLNSNNQKAFTHGQNDIEFTKQIMSTFNRICYLPLMFLLCTMVNNVRLKEVHK